MAKRKSKVTSNPSKQKVESVQISPYTGEPDNIGQRSASKDVGAHEALKLPSEESEPEDVGSLPNHARQADAIAKMSIKDKKTFLQVYRSGGPYSAFNSYTGYSRGVFDYLCDNASTIESQIARHDKEREESLAERQREAARINDRARETGTLALPTTKKSDKRWQCPPSKEKWFRQDAAVRTIEFLVTKYHGGWGPTATQEVLDELNRLEETA